MRPGSVFSSIAKTDWLTDKFVQWHPENGESCPCEPVFVARPGAGEENDGVVLTIIVNKKGTNSILVALDGRSLSDVASVVMPQVCGIGLHEPFIENRKMC